MICFRQIFIIVFIAVCFQNETYSQDTVLNTSKQQDTVLNTIRIRPGFFVGISWGQSQSTVKNEGTLAISKLVSSPQNSYAGSYEFGYYFSNYFGLSSGINYISYKTKLSLDTYQNQFNTIDSENDAFEMRVTGSAINEEQSVDFIGIPLCLNLRIPISQKAGFYLKGGANLLIPLKQNYTSGGIFTYKGYYPAFNDLLENLPQFGFPTNKQVDGKGELKLKSKGLNLIASAGFDFYVKKKFQLALGVSYNNAQLKSDEPNNTALVSPDKFQLSPDPDHINSFTSGSRKIAAQSVGIEMTLRFNF